MNCRKLKEQLFLASAMVILSLFMLVTATYAWYANNVRVTADGISISAIAEGKSFEINVADSDGKIPGSEGSTAEWINGQTIAEVSFEGASLYPTHPVIKSSYSVEDPATWYHTYSSEYDEAQGTNEQTELSVSVKDHLLSVDEESHYALVATYYIRLNPESSGEEYKLSNIKAMNVLITDESEEKENKLVDCVYLLVAGEDGAEAVTSGEDGSVSLVNLVEPDGVIHRIDVYAFFEGTDEDCKSSNYDPGKIKISVDFVGE